MQALRGAPLHRTDQLGTVELIETGNAFSSLP
jgi:hypothetical protein